MESRTGCLSLKTYSSLKKVNCHQTGIEGRWLVLNGAHAGPAQRGRAVAEPLAPEKQQQGHKAEHRQELEATTPSTLHAPPRFRLLAVLLAKGLRDSRRRADQPDYTLQVWGIPGGALASQTTHRGPGILHNNYLSFLAEMLKGRTDF